MFLFHKWFKFKNREECQLMLDIFPLLSMEIDTWWHYRICKRCGTVEYTGPCGTAAG